MAAPPPRPGGLTCGPRRPLNLGMLRRIVPPATSVRLVLVSVLFAHCGPESLEGDGPRVRTERDEFGLVTCSPKTEHRTCFTHRAIIGVSMGASGAGQAVQLTTDTGYFWFFNSTNVELIVKVLNACSFSPYYWVYAGGLTDVEVTLTVRDTSTGDEQVYPSPLGTPFQPITDSSAFQTCP